MLKKLRREMDRSGYVRPSWPIKRRLANPMSALKGFIGRKASALVPDRYGTAYGSRLGGRADCITFYFDPGSEITRLATSRFQMNSTTSAPMVAVMKPAPWSGP